MVSRWPASSTLNEFDKNNRNWFDVFTPWGRIPDRSSSPVIGTSTFGISPGMDGTCISFWWMHGMFLAFQSWLAPCPKAREWCADGTAFYGGACTFIDCLLSCKRHADLCEALPLPKTLRCITEKKMLGGTSQNFAWEICPCFQNSPSKKMYAYLLIWIGHKYIKINSKCIWEAK